MLYFTKYSEQKFDILNKHKVFITREQIEDTVKIPDKVVKKRSYFLASKDGVAVVYKKEGEIIRIYTFYPIK
jgi:hypothetical protein